MAKFFKLTKAEREELLPNTPYRKFEHRVHWAKMRLVYKGFIDNSIRGTWQITEKGKIVLAKYGDNPFQNDFSSLVTQLINEVFPEGGKNFPDDFLDSKEEIKFREINVPGTELILERNSRVIIVSPKGYFRYKAKNPPEALYILYSDHINRKIIKIPENNLIIFKAVKSYEKYIRDAQSKLFERFLELTNDETKSEELTKQVIKKLNLRTLN
ncbi:MAG: winged helix-turn-helix domain-containing protein [bacterium]|nr:winged helix-turn-helix domain-containing protein [bacterium]